MAADVSRLQPLNRTNDARRCRDVMCVVMLVCRPDEEYEMAPAKTPTKAQVAKYLTALLDKDMTLGDRAAIKRTFQIVTGERTLR